MTAPDFEKMSEGIALKLGTNLSYLGAARIDAVSSVISDALRSTWNAAIEEAAGVAKKEACGRDTCDDELCPGNYVSAAIRTLKSLTTEKEG